MPEKKQSERASILLLDGTRVLRMIKQQNDAYSIRYLNSIIPVARDTVIDGRQNYKQVQRFNDSY